jgi:hypothetical protein
LSLAREKDFQAFPENNFCFLHISVLSPLLTLNLARGPQRQCVCLGASLNSVSLFSAFTALLSPTPATALAVRYASKKTGGSSKNLGGKSPGKRFGIKKMEGEDVPWLLFSSCTLSCCVSRPLEKLENYAGAGPVLCLAYIALSSRLKGQIRPGDVCRGLRKSEP